jgi:hypothetical protein
MSNRLFETYIALARETLGRRPWEKEILAADATAADRRAAELVNGPAVAGCDVEFYLAARTSADDLVCADRRRAGHDHPALTTPGRGRPPTAVLRAAYSVRHSTRPGAAATRPGGRGSLPRRAPAQPARSGCARSRSRAAARPGCRLAGGLMLRCAHNGDASTSRTRATTGETVGPSAAT